MKNNQKGQALIELIIFLPLMITIYSVIGGFAGSISGSINQQKIARSYFYYRIQNNSTIPGLKANIDSFRDWAQFGMFYVGWKDYFDGNTPVMPCYKIAIPFKDMPNDKCEDAYTDTKTLWVRVGTVYGVCGATYYNSSGKVLFIPEAMSPNDDPNLFKRVLDKNSCNIQ